MLSMMSVAYFKPWRSLLATKVRPLDNRKLPNLIKPKYVGFQGLNHMTFQ